LSQERGEVAVVAPAGRIDSNTAAGLERAVFQRLDAGQNRLVVDLAGVEYISSAGLRVLLVMAKKVQQAKGKVALFGLSPNVREVFSVSGFDTIFSIQPDSAAALAAVR